MNALLTYTRRQLEERAAKDDPELTKDIGIRVVMSPRLALELMDFLQRNGERVEMVSFRGDPNNAEVKFFRR